ncbi:MAG: hypothetical protein JOY71_31285 [Acetobacteraceae bacterium]|nr:hypothetical protein [Acetobacteraceae bacterium]
MPASFASIIRPLFTQTDIDHMSFFCDLSSYDDVKTNAKDILGRLNGTGGNQMPPTSAGGPWPQAQIALFQKWINDGCQP